MKNLALKQRSVSLDLLRVFAAFWVLIHHWISTDALWRNLRFPYDVSWVPNVLSTLVKPGFLGVDIFFILSGIVIGRSAVGKSSSEFSVNRFLRLYPVYVVATIIAIALAPLSLKLYPRASELILSLTGLQWFLGWPTIVGPAWTLFYEIRFYMLIGGLIMIFGPLSYLNLRNAVKIWAALLLLAPSLQLPWLDFLIILEFGPYFALGMLLGLCNNNKAFRADLPVVLLLFVMAWVRMTARLSSHPDIKHHALLAGMLLVLTVLLLHWSNRHEGRTSASPDYIRNLISTLALMSYPLYLLHEHFGMFAIGLMAAKGVPVPIAFAGAFIFLLLLCWLSIKHYEPAARNILRSTIFFTKHQKPRFPTSDTESTHKSGSKHDEGSG